MRRLVHALCWLVGSAVGGLACAAPPPRFPPHAVWHQDIRDAPLHPQSASMISALAGLGGFGNGRMQIDFSLHVVRAPADAPMRSIVPLPSDGYYSPDCEAPGTLMPVPADAAIEGETGLSCDNDNGDCHLLVVQGDVLYEAYRANAVGGTQLQSQCLAVWKLDLVYPGSGRGEHCTSADAAGFPMAPLMFNADEVHAAMQVADGDLGHAIRFILPNARMASNPPNPGSSQRVRLYVRPASHAGGPSGPETSIPYGSRLRLRADFPVNLYPAAAQVILRTMQRHGIVLSDGGNIALTAESDRFTVRKWSELGINSRIFDQAVPSAIVRVQDFSVIDTGPPIIETYDCVRNPEPSRPSQLLAQLQSRYRRSTTQVVELQWQGGAEQVDIHRNGVAVATLANGGHYREKISLSGFPYSYLVCNIDSTACSQAAMVGPVRSVGPVIDPVD